MYNIISNTQFYMCIVFCKYLCTVIKGKFFNNRFTGLFEFHVFPQKLVFVMLGQICGMINWTSAQASLN